jgi:hypothetical protein
MWPEMFDLIFLVWLKEIWEAIMSRLLDFGLAMKIMVH